LDDNDDFGEIIILLEQKAGSQKRWLTIGSLAPSIKIQPFTLSLL
jgi:hypothetical protein